MIVAVNKMDKIKPLSRYLIRKTTILRGCLEKIEAHRLKVSPAGCQAPLPGSLWLGLQYPL